MNLYRVLLAAGIAVWSSSASAARFGWCEVIEDRSNTHHLSAVVDFGSAEYSEIRDGFGAAFQQFIKGRYDPNARSPDCTTRSTLSEARSFFKTTIDANPTIPFNKTEWTDGRSMPTETTEKSSAGAHLTVEKTGPTPAEAAAERTARELEGQRAAAAANAKRIADAARAQATTKARIDQFMAELKKRGSAQ
jgi:hypothetical protein